MKLVISLLLLGISLSLDYYPETAISFVNEYYRGDYHIGVRFEPCDCSNFISFAIRRAGASFYTCSGIYKYTNTIPLGANFKACLEKKGWKHSRGYKPPSQFKAGYPFFSGTYAMLATVVENGEIKKYHGHSEYTCGYYKQPTGPYDYYYL